MCACELMCYFTAPLQGLCVHEWVTTPLWTAPLHTVRVCSRLLMYMRGLTTGYLCVWTLQLVCAHVRPRCRVCAHVQRQSGSGSCAQPCCRESVCVCACTSTSLHCGSVCACMCACTSTSLQGVCVCAQIQHRCNVLVHACTCVHAQAQDCCKGCACTSTSLQGVCVHTHKHSIAARCVCTASLQCVCMLTACAHTCARVLCRCTQPPTPPMGADEPQGAPSPAFPPSTPPAAVGIDGSGGSPKVTPRSTRHALLQGAVLPPAPSLPGHPLVWGDVCDTQSPSRACSHLLGICVGAEKTWGANQARVLLAQPGTVRVSWLDGGDTPNGTPVWPPLGHILAFPQHPEPGDGTTWDEHPRRMNSGGAQTSVGLPPSPGGTGSIPVPRQGC